MNQIIKAPTVNFQDLVKNNQTTLSLTCQSKMIDLLNSEFTEEQSKWYIANLYLYLNYDSTTEYPINLENVYKMVGFANKGNAMKVIKNNFIVNEDYKTVLFHREKNLNIKDLGGRPTEDVMLNIDCFKSLCMIAKTPQGKEIRKYYVKLENIYNKIIKEEIESQKQIQENTQKQLQEKEQVILDKEQVILDKEQVIEQLENKPNTYGFNSVSGYNYLIKDKDKNGHYKIGLAIDPESRVSNLNCASSTCSLEILMKFNTNDLELSEKVIHYTLKPFRIKNRREWFYFKNDRELAYAINTIKKCTEFTNKFCINNYETFKNLDLNIEEELQEINKQEIILKKAKPRSGEFKGVYFCKEKNLWTSNLQHNYIHNHLGYFTDEIDAAKIYNDYALFLNQNENTNFLLNDIPGYISVPRNIPEINKKQVEENNSSKYKGVSYDKKRKYYVAGIQCNRRTYNLGSSLNELDCAKLYNQQALYFNNALNTKYILNEIPDYVTIAKDIYSELNNNKKKTSKYYGVSLSTANKWVCSYMMNRKKIHIGTYNTELEACEAYNKTVTELNKNGCKYKINKL